LVWRELRKGREEVLVVEVGLLVRGRSESRRIGAIRVFYLALSLAVLGMEAVP
jgi:hypothetical protein